MRSEQVKVINTSGSDLNAVINAAFFDPPSTVSKSAPPSNLQVVVQ